MPKAAATPSTPEPIARRVGCNPAAPLTAADRHRITNSIDLLIDLLDHIDGDTDREPDDLEEGGELEPDMVPA